MEALLIVDLQNDFAEGGSLAVPGTKGIVPYVNKLIQEYKSKQKLIVATQDYHPTGHISFASTHNKPVFSSTKVSYGDQILWPDHCEQKTSGADFIPGLKMELVDKIIQKGTNLERDSYSGFFENDKKTETKLDQYLRKNNITKLHIVGVALDVCVASTAFDAKRLGYEVIVDTHGSKAIKPEDNKKLFEEFKKQSINIL